MRKNILVNFKNSLTVLGLNDLGGLFHEIFYWKAARISFEPFYEIFREVTVLLVNPSVNNHLNDQELLVNPSVNNHLNDQELFTTFLNTKYI